MTTDAIKILINEQINLLQNPADLNDLLEGVTAFVDNRITPMPEETPAELDRLRRQLQSIEDGTMKLIPHEQVMREMKQFLEEHGSR